MLWMELLFAFVIALLFSVVFITLFRIRGPFGQFWVFMLVVFFATFAAVRWIRPAGDTIYGVYWMTGIFVALVVSLLIGAGATLTGNVDDKPDKQKKGIDNGYNTANVGDAASGLFFWLVLILLAIAAIAGVWTTR